MKRLFLAAIASCVLGCAWLGSDAREFPQWKVAGASLSGSCASVEPYVVRSGKEGIGIVVHVHGVRACTFALESIELNVGNQIVRKSFSIEPAEMRDGNDFRVYAPLAFDDNEAWNRGERTASLTIHATASDPSPHREDLGPWRMEHEAPR